MPLYSEYAVVPDDNKNGSIPTRMPEGNFRGSWVNDCLRYMASVIRNLGDSAAKLPVDGDGNPVATNGGKVGTIAFQDGDDVNLTGGIMAGVRGGVPIGAIISMCITWQQFLDRYAELFYAGWVACDGGTVINPYTNASVQMPDFRSRYLRMYANSANLAAGFGQSTYLTTPSGGYSGALTGDTALSADQIPVRTASQPKSGNLDTITGAAAQTANGHHHTLPTISDHQHYVDVLPPSINVIFFMRVW